MQSFIDLNLRSLGSHDDITSCKACGHGEDIKLKERFRAMILFV